MKKTVLSLFMLASLALSFEVFAAGGNGPPSGDGDGRKKCAFYDEGWDEDGPDYSCEACLENHGTCVKKCYRYSYTCTATGTDAETGEKLEFRATDRDRYYAEDIAIDRCYRARARNCTASGCNEDADLVSRRVCGRR